MKKILFKIRERVDGIEVLQEVIAEEYDGLTYYVSPRTNKNFKCTYSSYDKRTGLMVCYGKNKQELINKYNEVKERYKALFGGILYKKYIERYEQLKKEENKNV